MLPAQLSRVLRQRWLSVFRKAEQDTDLQRELTFHLEQLTAENIAEGMSPADARDAARRALGNVSVLAEECRDERRTTWVHDLWKDLGYGLRLLRSNLRFTVVATASLALGIGANTAILSTMNAALRSSLPLPDADKLVLLRGVADNNPGQTSNATVPEFLAWQERAQSFSAIGVSISNTQDLGDTGDGTPPERLSGQAVTPSLFRVLNVTPILGRYFTEDDGSASNPPRVIVLSHHLWQRRFGGDPNVIHQQVRMNGEVVQVIGVMPQGFWYPNQMTTEYWIPLGISNEQQRGSARLFAVTGRLKPGYSREQAQAELETITADLKREYPERQRGWSACVMPLREMWFGWLKQPLWMLEGAGALVLLLACVNVATLLVARSITRRPELAMRAALGAGRGRILRQLLTESVLLSSLGGLTGLAVAWGGLRMLGWIQPPLAGRRLEIPELDATMFGGALALALLAGLAFGIVPAMAALSGLPSLNAQIKNPRTDGLRNLLVAVQVGLALMLLIPSGLLMKTLSELLNDDRGFDPGGLLTFEFRIPPQEYLRNGGAHQGMPVGQSTNTAPVMQRVHQRLRAVPGVESAAGVSAHPVNSILVPRFTVLAEGRRPPETPEERAALNTIYMQMTPDYFDVIRATMVRGRNIDERDTASSPWVAVINETLARRLWPGEDPLGKRFSLDVPSGGGPRIVVGVVHDMALHITEPVREPTVYTSYLQQADQYRGPNANMFGQMTFVLRGRGDPMSLLPAVQRAVAEVEPNRAISGAMAIVWWGGFVLIDHGLYALVLGTFAAVAILLAAMGIYGVVAYTISQRTREIAIRIALGAGRGEIYAMLCKRGLVLISLGVVAGLIGAAATTRILSAQLWRVTPYDPAVFLGAAIVLTLVGIAATLAPVRRATKIDPAGVLRGA